MLVADRVCACDRLELDTTGACAVTPTTEIVSEDRPSSASGADARGLKPNINQPSSGVES